MSWRGSTGIVDCQHQSINRAHLVGKAKQGAGVQAAIVWKPQELRKDEPRTKAGLAARKGTPQRAPTPGTAARAPGSAAPSLAQSPALSQSPATTPGKCKAAHRLH